MVDSFEICVGEGETEGQNLPRNDDDCEKKAIKRAQKANQKKLPRNVVGEKKKPHEKQVVIL